jgi:hypothetical protein
MNDDISDPGKGAFVPRILVHHHGPDEPWCPEYKLVDGSLLGRCMLPWNVADGELTTVGPVTIDIMNDPRVKHGAKLRALFADETEIIGFVNISDDGLNYAGDELFFADCHSVVWHLLAEAPHPDKSVLDVLATVMGGRGLGVAYEGFLAELRTSGLPVEMENKQ